jgi:hypothetical protein
VVRLLSACAHAGGAPAADALGGGGGPVDGGGMYQTFSGVVVAELCDQFAEWALKSPGAVVAAGRALARQIRAHQVDGPAAKAALLASLAK